MTLKQQRYIILFQQPRVAVMSGHRVTLICVNDDNVIFIAADRRENDSTNSPSVEFTANVFTADNVLFYFQTGIMPKVIECVIYLKTDRRTIPYTLCFCNLRTGCLVTRAVNNDLLSSEEHIYTFS